MKLRTKLILSILAGSLFVSVLAGWISFYHTKSILETVVKVEHLELARQAEISTDLVFSLARNGAFWQALIISIAFFSFFLIVIVSINSLFIKPLNIFIDATKEIAKGNLEIKINVENEGEIGQLAKAFNDMISELKSSKENVEKRVAERTADLKKINRFMAGREIKMIDLKRQINELIKNQCHKD